MYREKINDYLKKFGESVGVEFDPLDASGYTQIGRGSATVGVHVFEDRNLFFLLAPIMPVPPAHADALNRRLLELNYVGTGEAAFAIDKDRNEVCVRISRGLHGLDYEEFDRAIKVISGVADQWDDRLKQEYAQP